MTSSGLAPMQHDQCPHRRQRHTERYGMGGTASEDGGPQSRCWSRQPRADTKGQAEGGGGAASSPRPPAGSSLPAPSAPVCPQPRAAGRRPTRSAEEGAAVWRAEGPASPCWECGLSSSPSEPGTRLVLRASPQLLAGHCQAQPTPGHSPLPGTSGGDGLPPGGPPPGPGPRPQPGLAAGGAGRDRGTVRPLPALAPTTALGSPLPTEPTGPWGLRPAAQTTWPLLKPAHYSKAIIYARDAPGTAGPVAASSCSHRPGQGVSA